MSATVETAAARGSGAPVTAPWRILVGVDFGVPSVRALQWVAGHLAPSALLHLVYVVDPAAGPGGPGTGDPIPDAEMGRLEAAASDRLNELAGQLSWQRASSEVRVGKPPEELSRAARAWEADLVCVGPHTRRGGLRRILGGTAELMLACSPVPVLLVANVRFAAPSRILAAVDHSEVAATVLRWAGTLRREHDAGLEVLRALAPGLLRRTRLVSTAAAARRSEQEVQRQARTHLEREVADVLDDPDVAVRVAVGRTARAILTRVEEVEADLLVLGAGHARSRSRVLLGSVARSVLTAAPCPVLVVREEACDPRG